MSSVIFILRADATSPGLATDDGFTGSRELDSEGAFSFLSSRETFGCQHRAAENRSSVILLYLRLAVGTPAGKQAGS